VRDSSTKISEESSGNILNYKEFDDNHQISTSHIENSISNDNLFNTEEVKFENSSNQDLNESELLTEFSFPQGSEKTQDIQSIADSILSSNDQSYNIWSEYWMDNPINTYIEDLEGNILFKKSKKGKWRKPTPSPVLEESDDSLTPTDPRHNAKPTIGWNRPKSATPHWLEKPLPKQEVILEKPKVVRPSCYFQEKKYISSNLLSKGLSKFIAARKSDELDQHHNRVVAYASSLGDEIPEFEYHEYPPKYFEWYSKYYPEYFG